MTEPDHAVAQEVEPDRAQAAAVLLVCDVDDTLVGDDAALMRLLEALERLPHVTLGLNSSRPVPSIRKTLERLPHAFEPELIIGAMGTQLWRDGRLDDAYSRRFDDWDRARVADALAGAAFIPHDDEMQSDFKVSFAVPAPRRDEAMKLIERTGQACKIIASGVSDLDVLPPGADKGAATLYAAHVLGVDRGRVIVAGDSANDLAMFRAVGRGIVVGNARAELRDAVDRESSFFAQSHQAGGVLEGLRYWLEQLS